jgi:hypothetical protein
LAFAPSSLILTNYFLPVNWALCITGDLNLSDIKDFFHILFFLVVGAIAILSYFQARKTLFSPIKTEIFKIQIEELKEVLAFFNKQNSNDFDHEFGINEIFELNSFRMHHSYVSNFFDDELKPSEDHLKHMDEISYGALICFEHLREITAGSELEDIEKEEKELNPAMKLAKWKEFELPMISFTKKFNDKQKELIKLAASPLLPKELTNLLYEFHSLMNDNLSCMGKVINECAQDLPTNYSTADDNRKFRPSWIWSKYARERKGTDEVSEKILKFINSHLKINDLV